MKNLEYRNMRNIFKELSDFNKSLGVNFNLFGNKLMFSSRNIKGKTGESLENLSNKEEI